jgi:hypothetical protein
MRKMTSLHQAILVDGSLEGFCIDGRAWVSVGIVGRGAVREGEEDGLGPGGEGACWIGGDV